MRTGYDNKTPVTLPSFTESCTTRLFDFSPHSSRQTTRNSHPFERDWRDWLAAMFPEVATFASHHEDFWQWVWEIERGVRPRPFCGIWPRGGGKALAVNTPIATPDGWKAMGDLRPGDTVFDHLGMPSTVTAVSAVQTLPCRRVVFNDGTSIVASDDHLWTVLDLSARRQMKAYEGGIVESWPSWKGIGRPPRRRCRVEGCGGWARGARLCAGHAARQQKYGDPLVGGPLRAYRGRLSFVEPESGTYPQAQARTLTTAEIADAGLVHRGERQFAIPVTQPLALADTELPIDAYLLGYWLGDGHSSGGTITIGGDDLDDTLPLLINRGFEARVHARKTAYSLQLIGLRPQLRAVGVLHDKHIPAPYLRAGRDQRLALLQGLLDADGSVHHAAASVLTTTNGRIAQGAAELARSLGLRPSVSEGRATLRGRDCGPVFDVRIPASGLTLHRLPRKHDALQETSSRAMSLSPRLRYITNIEPVSDQPVRCITVAGTDHLYLAGEGMIPTHNSSSAEMATAALGALGLRRYALYIAGSQEQAEKHLDSIAALLTSPEVERYYPEMASPAVNKFGSSRGWRRNRLTTASGFVVDAVGLRTGTRGVKFESQRPDLLILDDVDELGDTPEATQKKIGTFTKTLLPAGSTDVATLAIQNLIISDGMFARLSTTEGDLAAPFLRDRIISGPIPAVQDLSVDEEGDRPRIVDGSATWAGQSLAVCQQQIDDWGLPAFLAEAQHEVRQRGDKIILPEWWHGRARYDIDDPMWEERAVARFQSWDTAWEETSQAAYSSCVTGDIVPWRGGYALLIRNVWRGRVKFANLLSSDLLDVIVQMADSWRLLDREWPDDSGVVIEYAASGKAAVQQLRVSAPDGLRERIHRFTPRLSKDERAVQASRAMRAGRVWLPRPHIDTPWLPAFERELYDLPQAAFRDQSDAFVQLALFFRNYLRDPDDAQTGGETVGPD